MLWCTPRITSDSTLVKLNFSSSWGRLPSHQTISRYHGIAFIDGDEPGCYHQWGTVLHPRHHCCGPILQICPLQHPQDPVFPHKGHDTTPFPSAGHASVTKQLQHIQNTAAHLFLQSHSSLYYIIRAIKSHSTKSRLFSVLAPQWLNGLLRESDSAITFHIPQKTHDSFVQTSPRPCIAWSPPQKGIYMCIVLVVRTLIIALMHLKYPW